MSLLAEPSASTVAEPAWLKPAAGPPCLLAAVCTLGRSPENDLPLADDRVSRRHAVIRSRGPEGYFVSDLGSVNGTWLNGRRIAQRTRLFHGDRLTVGGAQFVFQQPGSPGRPDPTPSHLKSFTGEARTPSRWLLLVTIGDPAESGHAPASARDPRRLQVWFDDSRELVERAGGAVSHYTGDGFLTHWPDLSDAPERVAGALRDLQSRQERGEPPFRTVLHHGDAAFNHGDRSGAPGLTGEAVNFVLRMGRLAGTLGRPTLLSVPARALLGDHLPVTDAGVHAVPSFPGPFAFYALR